jgi:hypothetical protein
VKTTAWLAASAFVAGQLAAQSIASRVDAVRDGRVLMSFAARAGVCGDGHGSIWIQSSRMMFSPGDRQRECLAGPVRVAIARSERQIVSVRKWVGGRWSASESDVDIGTVSPNEAAHYLLGLAHTLSGTSGDDAISAAAFADAPDLAPDYTALIRDDNASVDARKQALFWLGQSDLPTADLIRLRESLKPFALREHYTFVLSQRRDDQAVDGLIDVARHDPDTEVRKRAMFWLGQTRDPKAIKFLQDLLTR